MELKPGERGRPAADKLKGIGIPTDLSCRSRGESRRIFSGSLGSRQELLIGQVRRRRSLRDKGQLQVEIFGLFAIPVADLAFPYIEGEVF